MIPAFFNRMELLVGQNAVEHLSNARVILFGVGGVGSWCAEGLVRSGIASLTIVDSDVVCVTNINRQLQATSKTVGQSKVDLLKQRLLEINPRALITAEHKIYSSETSGDFDLSHYDYVIDAIDSLSCKIELITQTLQSGAKLFSALGASARLDPSMIRSGSIWKSRNCRLGRFVRKRLRRRDVHNDFMCVYSEELPMDPVELSGSAGCGTGNCLCPKKSGDDGVAHEWCSSKKQINGSAVHITAIFGFMLCSLVVNDVICKVKVQSPDTVPEIQV